MTKTLIEEIVEYQNGLTKAEGAIFQVAYTKARSFLRIREAINEAKTKVEEFRASSKG